jgi:hypothetical protein
MSKKLETPTPPSATGTVMWLISSTILEEIARMFVTGKLSPSLAKDFAVDGRTHMADHIRSHAFPYSSNVRRRHA